MRALLPLRLRRRSLRARVRGERPPRRGPRRRSSSAGGLDALLLPVEGRVGDRGRGARGQGPGFASDLG
eukprot:8974367-Alexandrium_andersonii.AAC.1